MRAIIVNAAGDADQLVLTEVDTPKPRPGEVLVRHHAAGINYIDVYHRSGVYPMPTPGIPGIEGAGVVAALGDEVTEFAVGDRVAYAGPFGAYAEYNSVPADRVVALPDAVDARLAAAVLVQGITAHYLTRSCVTLGPGDTVLVHAVAGGVGLLLTQFAKRAGAYVIGTTSTEEKAERARRAGADDVILYTKDTTEQVSRITDGTGVTVAYDTVGRDTFDASLAALRRRGTLVLVGQSSGAVPPFDPALLAQRGSLHLTRPAFNDYIVTAEELRERAADVFDAVLTWPLTVHIDRTVDLAAAPDAHRALENRTTSGKLVLST